MISGSLWNYYKEEINDSANKTVANYTANNSKTTTSKSFEYNTIKIGRKSVNINTFDAEVAASLNYLNSF